MAYDLTCWMTNDIIQQKKLNQLVIPGTHDSGTYGLTDQLSTIKYSNIKFLWQLSSESAPANGTWPWKSPQSNVDPTYYLGQQAYNYIFGIIQQQSQSQDSTDTILNQLNNGIRFFDLRVYYDNTLGVNNYYIQHGLRGPLLQDILNDIASFIDNGKGKSVPDKELIFVQFSHTNFDGNNISDINNMLHTTLNVAIVTPPNDTDLITFFDTTLSDLTLTGSRVVVLNGDAPGFLYNSPYIFDNTFNATNSPTGVDNVTDLQNRELIALQNPPADPTAPWSISWVLTPQSADLVSYITQTTMQNDLPAPLGVLATQANASLSDFVTQVYGKYAFNLITCDWYQLPVSVENPGVVVQTAIDLSMQSN